jgi:hypothetical protein
VQRTGILIEKSKQVDFKGAAHRNIVRKASSSLLEDFSNENLNLIVIEKP